MTNKTLTSLIIRLAGFALFVKIFDFFGTYIMSIYMTSQMAVFDETKSMVQSFDKLYISGTVLSFLHLLLSLLLIFKADWIASKFVKNDSEIKIDLNTKSIMRFIISIIGIIYCAHTLFELPTIIGNLIEVLDKNMKDSYVYFLARLTKYIIKAVIGILFIYRSEQLSNFAMKKMKSL
jgi:hypothetical protein